MQMTDVQERAVRHRDGPAMILAGPGSGKTFVLTQRIKYLIDSCQINPREILVLTFTKAAARQMQERFELLCSLRGTCFGTFHAVFFDILRHAGGGVSKKVMSEQRKQSLLCTLLKDCEEEAHSPQDTLPILAAEISRVKNEKLSRENFKPDSCSLETFWEVFQRYEEIHRRWGCLDFDDMLSCTLDLFRERDDLLEVLRQRWRYLLVDEFQDINRLQYEILKLLAAPANNLFVVGDDDQSIYRFRGASPDILLGFPEDYPDAKKILLDQNFRSSPAIIGGAARVIGKNIHRYPKKIRPVRPDSFPIEKREFQNQEHESLYLAKEIRDRVQEGLPCSEIAILVRLNRQIPAFEKRLAEFQIPCRMRGQFPCLYDHWIAKDVFAYLKLAREGLKRTEFLQVMNRPNRYLSRRCLEEETVSFERLRFLYRDKGWMCARIDRFASDLERIGALSPFAAVNYIRFGVHYEDYLRDYAAERYLNPEELLDVLGELQESAKPYRTFPEWYRHMEDVRAFLKENQERTKKEERAEAVSLLTLHASKGLEFSEVFLPDVNEKMIPHRRAFSEEDLEEERRLFYVGMTRAKDRLHLFCIREQYGKLREPSRFLADL